MDATENGTALYELNSTVSMNDIRRRIYIERCKNDPLPSAQVIVQNMNVFDVLFHVLLLLVSMATIGIFVELVFFLKNNIKQAARRRFTILQAGIPAVYAASSVVGIFSPAGYVMIDFVSSVYFGFAMHAFLVLCVNYYNGIRQLLLRFEKDNQKFLIRTGPLCCLFCCFPQIKMTRKSFTILWYATFQAAFFRPVILFFEAVFREDKSIVVPSMFYAGLLITSMLTGVWALVILRKASADFLSRFKITGKYFLFQLILLTSNVQPFVIKLAYLSCDLPHTILSKQIILNYQIMIFEFFVFALLTRFLYRRESDNDLLEFIQTDGSDKLKLPVDEKALLAQAEMKNGDHIIVSIGDNNRGDVGVETNI